MADLNKLAQESEALKKILKVIVEKWVSAGGDMQELINVIGDIGDMTDTLISATTSATDRVRQQIDTLRQKLTDAEKAGNSGEARDIQRNITQKENREHYLRTGNAQGVDLYNNITSYANSFKSIGDNLASSINKYIEFQTKMQTLQLDMIRSGWETISQGQTPYMSKSMQITTDYTKTMLELNTEQTKTMNSGIASLGGTIIGGIVGTLVAPGAGTVIGGVVGASSVGGIMGMYTDYMTAEKKKEMEGFKLQMEQIGVVSKAQKDFQAQKLGIGSYLAMNDQSTGGMAGVEGNLYNLYNEYAGIPGFSPKEMIPLLSQMGMSKQFGKDSGTQMGMGTNANILSGVTGLGNQEILSYFSEMRMKLNVPIDQLVGRFGGLVEISDRLQIPLKQVMSDLMDLSVANNRFGFSQNVVNGLYNAFGEEVKANIVTMADLKKVMEGMSQTPLDKATGIGALLNSLDTEGIVSRSGTQNPENMRGMLNAMKGMSGMDPGLFLKLASQPDADKNPFMQDLMQKYGLTNQDLKAFQPEVLKSGLGASRLMGEQGSGSGVQQYIMEVFSGILGNQLSPDLLKQSKEIKAIETLGDKSGSLGTVTKRMEEMDAFIKDKRLPLVKMETEFMMKLTVEVDKLNKKLSSGIDPTKAFGQAIGGMTDMIIKESLKMKTFVNNTGFNAPENIDMDALGSKDWESMKRKQGVSQTDINKDLDWVKIASAFGSSTYAMEIITNKLREAGITKEQMNKAHIEQGADGVTNIIHIEGIDKSFRIKTDDKDSKKELERLARAFLPKTK